MNYGLNSCFPKIIFRMVAFFLEFDIERKRINWCKQSPEVSKKHLYINLGSMYGYNLLNYNMKLTAVLPILI